MHLILKLYLTYRNPRCHEEFLNLGIQDVKNQLLKFSIIK